jgi:hypothetical protein
MADRFWVGGTGNWNDTAKWSATSGGAGGASVPTAADNAYFDDESDTGAAFTVTINVASTCKDLIIGDGATVTALDQTMTLAGSSALAVSGSLYFPATNLTRTYTGVVTFNATTTGHTITTNGVTLTSNAVNFDGVNGAWTLGSAFTIGNNINLLNGSFDTNSFNISGISFVKNNSNNFTIISGSSTFNLTGQFLIVQAGTIFDFSANNVITSTVQTGINIQGNSPTTFADITFTNITGTNQTQELIVVGQITCTNFTVNERTTAGLYFMSLYGSLTVTGTLTFSGTNAATSRLLFRSGTFGSTATVSAAVASIGDGMDFRDIAFTGAAAPIDVSSNNVGDCKGNSGITFAAPKTVYWNLAGSQNYNANAWATTPTGTPAAANFPLAQDTAVVTEAGNAGTITINNAWNIGTLTFDDGVSTRTSAATLNFSTGPTFYGDLKLSSGAIISGTGAATFAGRSTQNITSAGKTFTNGITLDSPGGTLVLQDNLTLGTDRAFTLTSGTLNLNGKVPSFGIFNSNNSNTRSIAFGSSKIQISGNNTAVVNCGSSTNFTYTGSGLFELTYSGSTGTREISADNANGAIESNALNFNVIAGSDTFGWFGGAKAFRSINLTGFSGTFAPSITPFIYGSVTLSPTMTYNWNTGGWWFNATSGVQSFFSAGKTIPQQIQLIQTSTLRFEDNFNCTNELVQSRGTVNLNGKNVTLASYSSSNSNVRTLTFGSGQLLLTGTGTVFNAATATNMTITPGTGKIVLANNTNTARTFAGGGLQTYPELEFAGDTGTATTTITGSNRFRKLTNSKLVAYTIVFPNAITSVDDWNLNGSPGNLITLSRTGGSGTFTINYSGTQYGVGRYLSISNSTATPVNRMYALFSTDGGSNTGWIFDAPKFGQFLTFFVPPL